MTKYVVVLCIAFFVGGCAIPPLNQAHELFQKHEYGRAATIWNPLANDGDPYAQHGLGLLWEFGLGKTPKNPTQAAHWYLKAARQNHIASMVRLSIIQRQLGFETAATAWATLAARWNDDKAIKLLQEWAQPIPVADLYRGRLIQEQNQRAQQQQSANNFMNLMAIGVMGIGNGMARGGSNNIPPPIFDSSSRSAVNPSRESGTSSGALSLESGQNLPYRGLSGQTYQYDLSRPQDRLRYDLDPKAQIMDSVTVDPRRDLDRSLGQHGGGVSR